jgi:hypothetical protein
MAAHELVANLHRTWILLLSIKMTIAIATRRWLLGFVALIVALVAVLSVLPVADPLPPQLRGWRTVSSYFDQQPPWTGKPWTRGSRTVGADEVAAIAGQSHCGWESVTFLVLAWPVGTKARNASEARQYVRDPKGIIGTSHVKGFWARNPIVPGDAVDTGYRYGAVRLLLAPSDSDFYVYVVAPRDSERWPRGNPPAVCS